MEITELQSEELGVIMKPYASEIGWGGDHSPPRSSGPHVSEIIRDLSNTVIKPGQRLPIDQLTGEEKRRMGNYVSMGWAWEEIIRRAMKDSYYAGGDDRFVSPGECQLDGIFGTPDWIDSHDWCLEEFKATWRSSRRSIQTDYWSWVVQIKAYCKMLAMEWARLRVFFVNGNYKESGPQLKVFLLHFEEAELDKNWAMLRGHAVRKGWLAV